MYGINLDKKIEYLYASLRFFAENEHHICRFCKENVLLLVYDGVLRFSENETEYEVKAGEYFIQEANSFHDGRFPSDAPKYLYVHFLCEWSDGEETLNRRGKFDYYKLKPLIDRIDDDAHGKSPYIKQAADFYEILLTLHISQSQKRNSLAVGVADYISKEYSRKITLDTLCREFHFSKNHILHVFKQEFCVSPITFLNATRLKNAEYLIEVTSESTENISLKCGYPNYSHFYRQFVKKNGVSPSKWREEKRLGKI